MINQVIQQSNQKKKAITSIIIGIFSFLPIITLKFLMGLILSLLKPTPVLPLNLQIFLFIIFFVIPFISIIGLILGILALKSPQKKLAIVGIILCMSGLLTSLIIWGEFLEFF
jgi:uncharacterized membrane protein